MLSILIPILILIMILILIPLAPQHAGLPLCAALEAHTKADPLEPRLVVPRPALAPLPQRHSFATVSESLEKAAFGVIADENLLLMVTIETVSNEELVEKPPLLRARGAAWTLPASVFLHRAAESDDGGFFSTERGDRRIYDIDWARSRDGGLARFVLYEASKIATATLNVSDPPKVKLFAAQELAELRLCLNEHFKVLSAVFRYYCAIYGAYDPAWPERHPMHGMPEDRPEILRPQPADEDGDRRTHQLHLTEFMKFCDAAYVPDEHSKFCKRNQLPAIFEACSSQAAIADDGEANPTAAAFVRSGSRLSPAPLTRYQWLCAVVRLAVAKYGRNNRTIHVAEAVDAFVADHVYVRRDGLIMPVALPAETLVDPNDFRRSRLYLREAGSPTPPRVSVAFVSSQSSAAARPPAPLRLPLPQPSVPS